MGTEHLGEQFLRENLDILRKMKETADKALAQLEEKDYHFLIDAESNSIAILMQHLSGNLKSRYTDFLTSDGEKKDRNRDGEFEDVNRSVDTLKSSWEYGWNRLFDTLSSLTETDLDKTVYIRGEAHSVLLAISRTLYHCAYHVGQIVLIAKHIKESSWKTLSVPKKK